MTLSDGNRSSALPMVSVIVPVLNAEATLGYQLEALAGQTYRGEWEVIISDNGSVDASVDVAESFADRLPGLQVVDASDRRGASHARNVGATAGRGDLLLFCDADDIVSAGWIGAMADAAREYDMVGGGLETRSLNPEGSTPPSVDRLRVPFGFLPIASGGNCGIHASVLQALGGWSEDWAGLGQDLELSWRVQLASYRLAYAPAAFVHHRGRVGLAATWRQAYKRGCDDPRIYRAYRSQGARRPRAMGGLKAWALLLVRVGDLLHEGRRRRWVHRAGIRVGRVRGSIRYHVAVL